MSTTATPEYQSHEERHTELKIYLIRRGLSQRQLARKLGITIAYLNHILCDRRKGTGIRRRLVCEFGIPAELVGYVSEGSKAA